MSADLHTHTTASDGRLTPEVLVEEAKKARISHLAITDHDTIEGILSLQKKNMFPGKDIVIIAGVEFSTDLPNNEVHILGYNIDIQSNELRKQLSLLVEDRWQRIHVMIDKLAQLGYFIEFDRVKELAGQTTSIGRPHIARAIVEKNYYATTTEVFNQLLYKNGPAYVPHYKLEYSAVIQLIREANGVSVLAHPGLVGDDTIVKNVIEAGIAGLEVYHPKHSAEQIDKYYSMARQYNLLITGGSDFHAIPGRYPDTLGIFTVPALLAKNLLQYPVISGN